MKPRDRTGHVRTLNRTATARARQPSTTECMRSSHSANPRPHYLAGPNRATLPTSFMLDDPRPPRRAQGPDRAAGHLLSSPRPTLLSLVANARHPSRRLSGPEVHPYELFRAPAIVRQRPRRGAVSSPQFVEQEVARRWRPPKPARRSSCRCTTAVKFQLLRRQVVWAKID